MKSHSSPSFVILEIPSCFGKAANKSVASRGMSSWKARRSSSTGKGGGCRGRQAARMVPRHVFAGCNGSQLGKPIVAVCVDVIERELCWATRTWLGYDAPLVYRARSEERRGRGGETNRKR